MRSPPWRTLFLLGVATSCARSESSSRSIPGTPYPRVIVVDDDGPADFASLHAAVALAPEGALVLVREGAYDIAPELVIDGKALTLVADGANVRLTGGPLVIRHLGSSQRVVADGFVIASSSRISHVVEESVVLEEDAGLVWIEDCTVGVENQTGILYSQHPAVAARRCAAVVLVRTSAFAAISLVAELPSPEGVLAEDSRLFLFETRVRGGEGTPVRSGLAGDGGDGVELDGGFLFAAGSALEGGRGGFADGSRAIAFAGDGGAGLRLIGVPPDAFLVDVDLQGGAEGQGRGFNGHPGFSGEPSVVESGMLTALGGISHAFALTSPVSSGGLATATFHGIPGERVWYLLSNAPEAGFRPRLLGSLAVQTPYRIIPAGELDASGVLTVSIPAVLAHGAQGSAMVLQALFQHPAQGFTLATPSLLTVLDLPD